MYNNTYIIEVSKGPKGEKCSWVRVDGRFDSFLSAQDAAINNAEYPYRIKRQLGQTPQTQELSQQPAVE
jgi:hypothetical protein